MPLLQYLLLYAPKRVTFKCHINQWTVSNCLPHMRFSFICNECAMNVHMQWIKTPQHYNTRLLNYIFFFNLQSIFARKKVAGTTTTSTLYNYTLHLTLYYTSLLFMNYYHCFMFSTSLLTTFYLLLLTLFYFIIIYYCDLCCYLFLIAFYIFVFVLIFIYFIMYCCCYVAVEEPSLRIVLLFYLYNKKLKM